MQVFINGQEFYKDQLSIFFAIAPNPNIEAIAIIRELIAVHFTFSTRLVAVALTITFVAFATSPLKA